MFSFAIKEIFQLIGRHQFYGDENYRLEQAANFEPTPNADYSKSVMWLSDSSIANRRDKMPTNIGLLVLSERGFASLMPTPQRCLVVQEPRLVFQQIVKHFFEQQWTAKTETTAIVHHSAVVPASCYIGHFVVVEEGVVMGENCFVGHHTVIHAGTQIGENVILGTHNTIGGVGFGYAKMANGHYDRFSHLGNVILENHVVVHNNTCIDRAVLGSTRIGEGTKIDNLVHVAHGVQIGKHTLVIANSMIAGSTKIGDNCWIAPSVSVLNKLNVGDGATLGMGAVVLKDVAVQSIVFGNPGKEKEAK